jgi:class 3 adenylate cyclase
VTETDFTGERNPEKEILLVEDSPDMQRIVPRQLAVYGLHVTVMPDGKQALEWLNSHHPAVILLDWMLPEMTGLEVCQIIRKRYTSTKLPILMLTALGAETEHRVEAIRAGANDILPKPYNAEELAVRIQSLMAIKEESAKQENLLERYTSSALQQQAKLGHEVLDRREFHHAVILFADLRGFTNLTASAAPEQVMDVLDSFFNSMMSIIEKHGGAIFDLTGDELLAVFNVPHETPLSGYLAVKASFQMHSAFNILREKWSAAGHSVGLGVGIHQGGVMVGNIGGAGLMRYTVIGNAVNYAHRLVEIAGDGATIVSPEVYQQFDATAKDVRAEMLPGVRLKGIDEPQMVIRLEAAE